jgi:DNA repair protein RadC
MSIAITNWAEEDRPREKMVLKGKQALSDAELLAILIGSGTIGQDAVSLAKEILQQSNNNLNELGRKTLKELEKNHKGIGEAKAITIVAALEIGRRRQISDIPERPKIESSKDAARMIAPIIADLNHEEFWVLFLNRNNEVTERRKISQGGSSSTVVDVKMLFKTAIELNASGIIAVHNHPSGSLQPSKEDLSLTKKIKEAGLILDVKLMDHLIISERGYYSFADHGTLGG